MARISPPKRDSISIQKCKRITVRKSGRTRIIKIRGREYVRVSGTLPLGLRIVCFAKGHYWGMRAKGTYFRLKPR